MNYILSVGGVVQYPYSIHQLKLDNSNVSFPDMLSNEQLADFNVFIVELEAPPIYDNITETVVEIEPVIESSIWKQQWQIVGLTSEQITNNKLKLKSSIEQQTQQRLDNFAKSRNYDGILSCCSYVNSANVQFNEEADYCLIARDETWAVLYQILSDVENDIRSMPSGYYEIESELPVLQWPN